MKQLSEIAERNHSDETTLQRLIHMLFRLPPQHTYFPKSQHKSKKYGSPTQQNTTISLASSVLERCVNDLMLQGYRNIKWQNNQNALISYQARFFGKYVPSTSVSEKENVRLQHVHHLFERAAFYQISGLGACSFRAAFASLELKRAFKDNDKVKIYYESTPSRDHFTVMMGVPFDNNSAKTIWYVYDPLTNPEIIFPIEMFIKEILPTFEEVQHDKRASKVELMITDELVQEYDICYPKIEAEIKSLWDKEPPTVTSLQSDANFIASMRYLRVNPDEKQLTAAIELASELINNDTPYEPPLASMSSTNTRY